MDELQAIVEWLDPDWKEHFIDVEHAAREYMTSCPGQWAEAILEITGRKAWIQA